MKISSKKFSLLLAGVLSVGIGIYFFSGRERGPIDVTVISVTDSGFIPEEITVQKGTKLIFRNDGQIQHWPASNFHPTHSLYPEKGGCLSSVFDACHGLQPGETFEFAVNIVGEWSLHDHLFPGLLMTVSVVEKTDDQKSDTKKYDNSAPSAEELRGFVYSDQLGYVRAVAKKDPVKAWDYIKSAFVVSGQVVGNVHDFAHIVGNEMYSKYGLKGVLNCDTAFAYGCFHGVTEKLLQDRGSGVVKNVQNECLKILPASKSQGYTGCIHGMGHGLLAFENFDIKAALGDCDMLDDRYKTYCYDGVFMENSLETSQKYDSGNPWQFCKGLAEHYQYNCARYQSQFFINEFKRDIASVTNSCAKAASDKIKTTCFESVGYHVAQTAKGDFSEIKTQCFGASTDVSRSVCIIGAAREVIYQKYQDWEKVSGELCEVLSGNLVQDCLESNKRALVN